MELIIKKASVQMLDQIMRVENSSFSDPWSRGAFLHLFSNPIYRFYVCHVGTAFSGYIIGMLLPPEAEVINLAVDIPFRRAGVASALLERLIFEAEESGCHSFYLEVRRSNMAAIELYKKHGFMTLGTRKKYYRCPVEDALIMARLKEGQSQAASHESKPS